MRVDGLPAKADSQAIMDDTAAYHQTHGGPFLQFAPFGQAHWDAGYSSGYLVDRLPASMNPSTSRVTWFPNLPDQSMAGQHLYFNDLRQQGAVRNVFTRAYDVTYFGDRHSIMWSESSRELVETIGYNGTGPYCRTVTTYNLDSYTLPLSSVGSLPAGAIAVRVPVAPFFFTYQDLVDCGETGDLGHMVGWTAAEYQTAFQWPARASDGKRSSGVRGGEVIRLKSTFNLSVLPTAPLRALGRTLQRYGAMLFDKNSELGDPAGLGRAWIVTCSDPAWTPAHRVAWGDKLGLNQFDAVDISSISGANRSIAISGSPPSANPAPVAVITNTRADGKAPLAVSFSASGSSDNGSISSYAWDFGDSASSTGVTAAHTYSASGVYTARLTVTDNLGATASTIAGWSPRYPLDVPEGMMRVGVAQTSAVSGFVNPASKYETPSGKALPIHRRYFGWSEQSQLIAAVSSDAALGRASWVSIDVPNTATSWADISAGSMDSAIDALLIGLRDTGIQSWLTPAPDAEHHASPEATVNVQGTAANWKTMIARFEARVSAVSASNVLIVPVLSSTTWQSRTPADWVSASGSPLVGVTHFSNGEEPSSSWISMVQSLKAAGKDIAISEFANSSSTPTTGMLYGATNAARAAGTKALCYFDQANSQTSWSTSLSGSPLTAYQATLIKPFVYRGGLTNTVLNKTVQVAPSTNTDPIAASVASTGSGRIPLAVSFSASGSSDNGSISSYAWDFGDSASSTGVTAAHTYSASGVYTARLTVTDNLGATASIPKTISAFSAPPSGSRCSPQTLVFSNSLSASGSATVWGVTLSSFAGVTTARVGYGGSIAVSGSTPGTVPASGWSNPTLVSASLPFVTPRLAVNGGSAHVQKHILAPTGCGRYTIYIWSKPVGTTSMTAYYSTNGTTWTAV